MKLLKKITCTLLVAILVNTSIVTPVFATEAIPEEKEIVVLDSTITPLYETDSVGNKARSTTFIDTSILITYSESGMKVVIFTDLNDVGTLVGVKDIKIQRKTILGTWTTVATSSGGEVTNANGCIVTVYYEDAVEGETYRVTCTHYWNVDEYRELYHETVGTTCAY